MKLWSGLLSPFSAKVRIVLAEKDLPVEIMPIPWSRQTLWGPKPSEFVAVSPRGQVPVLIDGDVVVYDSTVICEYLEDRYPSPPLSSPPTPPAGRAAGSSKTRPISP
jgi:glutathione S-transferase